MRRLAASNYEMNLIKNKQYLRFYMLTFDAGLERDPVQATRDFLENSAYCLEPSDLPIPEPLRVVYLRRDAYGESSLTFEEISVLSEVLGSPTDTIIEISKKLITSHVRLSEKPCPAFSDLLELFFEALEKPKRRGRTSEQYADRNSTISSAVKRLINAGFKKTGGDFPACAVVSDELCRLGHPISADGVRKIVDAHRPPPVNDEMFNMVVTAASEGMSADEIRSRDEAWLFLEELGKKEGYIPSGDLG